MIERREFPRTVCPARPDPRFRGARRTIARPPLPSRSAAACSRRTVPRAAMATSAPSSTAASAMPKPMPAEPPMTSTLRPSSAPNVTPFFDSDNPRPVRPRYRPQTMSAAIVTYAESGPGSGDRLSNDCRRLQRHADHRPRRPGQDHISVTALPQPAAANGSTSSSTTAPVFSTGRVVETPTAVFAAQLDAGLNAVFSACREAAAVATERGAPLTIVNVVSALGIVGLEARAAEACASFGLLAATKALAAEWGPARHTRRRRGGGADHGVGELYRRASGPNAPGAFRDIRRCGRRGFLSGEPRGLGCRRLWV